MLYLLLSGLNLILFKGLNSGLINGFINRFVVFIGKVVGVDESRNLVIRKAFFSFSILSSPTIVEH